MSRALFLLLAVGALAGCNNSSQPTQGIVVPGPSIDPSPLAQANLNGNHVHAIAIAPGASALLVGTHHGVELVAHGASPASVIAPTVSGDVLQVLYGANGDAYASGHNLGVSVSHDGGHNWEVVSPDVAGLDVHGLAADPRTPSHMVAYAVGKGLLFSEDAGAHWTHHAGWADTHYLTGLVITADGTMLAGSPELGVAATPDGGVTFQGVRNGTGRIYSLAASATSADVVAVATENGMFLTTDGGKTWAVGVPISAVAVTAIAIDPLHPTHMFAGDSDGLIFASTDSGNTWGPY